MVTHQDAYHVFRKSNCKRQETFAKQKRDAIAASLCLWSVWLWNAQRILHWFLRTSATWLWRCWTQSLRIRTCFSWSPRSACTVTQKQRVPSRWPNGRNYQPPHSLRSRWHGGIVCTRTLLERGGRHSQRSRSPSNTTPRTRGTEKPRNPKHYRKKKPLNGNTLWNSLLHLVNVLCVCLAPVWETYQSQTNTTQNPRSVLETKHTNKTCRKVYGT